VRIETETGLVGWGEGSSLISQDGGLAKVREVVNTIFGPTLIGRDPTEPMVIWKELQTLAASTFGRDRMYLQKASIAAISAIDIALWDISGQAKGQPVHKLLSNVVRSKIKVCVDISLHPFWEQQFSSDSAWRPASSVPQPEAQSLLDLGFDTFEVSLLGSLENNMQSARATRYAFGRQANIVVRQSTSRAPAEELVCAMSTARVSLLVGNLAKYPEDSPRLSVPMAWGDLEWKGKALCDGMAGGDVDILQPNIIFCGGFTALLRILTIAKSHDVLVMPSCHTRRGSGIALAATIQASAAVPWKSMVDGQEPNPKEPMISLSPDVLDIRNQFLVQNIDGSGGYLHVSERPGLGTTVDEQALSRMAIQ
jgi:D-galactarolactone cycloisomerase